MNKITSEDKIFIAGAHGMAGKAITRNFIKNGYKFLFTPTRSELNLFDPQAVKEWFSKNKPNVVVIAAAKVGGILANSTYPTEFLLENLKLQNNLIETSWKFGVKRLLFLGSSCIYPKFATQPIEEESLLSGKLEITNESYAIAKIAGIKLCTSLRIQYGFDAISLMPTNLYGYGDNYDPDNSHVMASLMKKFFEAKSKGLSSVTCWGSGKPFREFLHVDDLGSAVSFALEKWDPDAKNAPLDKFRKPLLWLNVGTGKDISIYDLAKKISATVGFNGEIIWDTQMPDGTPKKMLNIEKMKSLGWEPKISLKEGIKKTLDNYKSNIK